MKVRASVKKICDKCKVIRRHGVVRVICENSKTQAEAGVEHGTYCRRGSSAQQVHQYRADVHLRHRQLARAAKILAEANVDANRKVSDLTEEEANRIRTAIENGSSVEGDLRKDVSMHIKRLIEIGSYRGYRHRRSLPVRGQRTHTNARTRKGPRKGTVANKKKATAK